MHIDVQKALEADIKLRAQHHNWMKITKFLFFPFYMLIIGISAIPTLLTIRFFPHVVSDGKQTIIVTVTFISVFMVYNLATFVKKIYILSLYDNEKFPSFILKVIKKIHWFPHMLVYALLYLPLTFYSFMTLNHRYYFAQLAPFCIIDQGMNSIAAIKKTYYFITDDQVKQLLGMGDFGYANLYRQMYPKMTN